MQIVDQSGESVLDCMIDFDCYKTKADLLFDQECLPCEYPSR